MSYKAMIKLYIIRIKYLFLFIYIKYISVSLNSMWELKQNQDRIIHKNKTLSQNIKHSLFVSVKM